MADMNTLLTLDAFHMRCQWQILYIRWWVNVSNAEVLQRSGLSPIGDILRHRRLSLFGHVARLDPRAPTHGALRLMVRRQKGQLKKTAGSPSQRLAQQDSGGCQRSTAIYRCGDLRSPGVTERIDGNSDFFTWRRWWWWWWWWRMTDLCQKWRVKLIFQGIYRLPGTGIVECLKSLT